MAQVLVLPGSREDNPLPKFTTIRTLAIGHFSPATFLALAFVSTAFLPFCLSFGFTFSFSFVLSSRPRTSP